jgi:EAL and modified HD-GYP domain-containing signal transduction protein
MLRAAFRASLMETLTETTGASRDELDCAFMVGMFSLLDLLFGCSLFEILKPLNISDEARNALLERGGKLGQILKLVELADRENNGQLAIELSVNTISATTFYRSVAYTYSWVNQICQDM